MFARVEGESSIPATGVLVAYQVLSGSFRRFLASGLQVCVPNAKP